jgi:hypothetical protein
VVSRGRAAFSVRSARAAREIARRLGGRAVDKAQVKTGGRGKAGGVAPAADPAAAKAAARRILGMDIRDHPVGAVMVAEPVDTESEFDVSYVLDRAAGGFLAIASADFLDIGGASARVMADGLSVALVATLSTDDRATYDRLAPQLRAFQVGHGVPRSRGDRDELFGGLGASWSGAFVGGDLLVRAVTQGPAGEWLPGNFSAYQLMP